ncbi:MAG TPA: Gfo/Idh/MocA family oxidoreductase [Gemmataceae bacterium]|nr:Gfo/Idh/MocA family oxidoreductase [Gemmataceae bacterium]
MNSKQAPKPAPSRRAFLATTAASAATVSLGGLPAVHASSSDIIRVGLVGCGGRGTGAAQQCANGGQNVKIWAVGDAFLDRANTAQTTLRQRLGTRAEIPDSRRFVGLNAYQEVIANSDLVILATPPGFRPLHIRAVIEANKNLFTEKPVAVDGPGIRTVLAMHEEANRRGLKVVCGLQRHHQTGYQMSMDKIHSGALGTITSARCYWNQGGLWSRTRTAQMSDLEWQLRNWLYFTWLSGDHIVEQHVHNLDVVNWALQAHPTRCVGMGGRQSRTQAVYGHIFDHFAIEYEYPNNVHVLSMCRQIDGAENNVSEAVTGTKGTWTSRDTPGDPNNYRIRGENAWTFARNRDNDPYQKEHNYLQHCIRQNRQVNDLRYVAESTLTAIMGRMSAYSGRAVTWQDALNSTQNLVPANLAWDMSLPVPPVASGGTQAGMGMGMGG